MKRNGDKSKRGANTHKQAQKEPKLSQIKYKALFDNISSGVAIYEVRDNGEDFVFVDFNRAAERIEKIKKEDLIGKSVLDVFPHIKDFGLFEVFQRVWKTGKAEDYPISQYRDERIVGWRENHVYKLPSGDIVAVYDDVTERKRSEQSLKMSEQCFHAIADYSCFWEIWVNPKGQPIWTNPASQQITGYSSKEIMAMRDYPLPLVYEKDQAKMARAFRSALNGGSGREFQFRIRRKDGSVIWAEMSWQPIYDEKNNSIGHRVSIRDITKRRYAEQKYATIIQTALDSFWICDKSGRILDVNDSLCNMLGYNRKELLSMFISDIDISETNKQTNHHINNILKGKHCRFETRHRCKDGSIIDVEVSANYIDFEGGQFFASFRDITSRKKTEQKLNKARDLSNTLIQSSPIFFVAISGKGKTIMMNQAMLEALGYKKEEVIGTDYSKVFVPEHDRQTVSEVFEKIIDSHDITVNENHVLTKDGRDLLVEWRGRPVFKVDGEFDYFFGVGIDITERRVSELARQKLNRELAAKNKELESVLYAASHDLKSPLVNIQGFCHELSESCELIRSVVDSKIKTGDIEMASALDVALNENIPNALNFILASSKKMDSLLSGLLDVCRLNTTVAKMKQIDMNALISNVVSSMKYQINQSAAKIDIEALVPCVGDFSQINRVFSNLLANSLKFLDESKPARIRIYGRSENDISIYCLEDNGIGIAPEHQEKIFQMFYQLEPGKRQGQGIGLTIVRQIIDKHDGKLWLESEEGKGSKFFLSLPNV